MKWFLYCMKKYATFNGRASRAEYWWFALVTTSVNVVCRITMTVSPLLGALILGLFSLGVVLPHLAVGTRRLHDVGVSGWWLVAMVVVSAPLVAFTGHLKDVPALALPAGFAVLGIALMLLFFLCHRGDPNPNQYGDLPPSAPG